MKTETITGHLTHKEFIALPSGTKAKRVKYFDGDGKQYPSTYVLLDDPDFDEELHDAKQVVPGYFTETWNVSRK